MNTSDLPLQSETSLLHALSENWNHCRHLEDQRSSFAKMFVTTALAVFAYLSRDGFDEPYVLVLLIMFALLGILLTTKINSEFSIHMNANKETLRKLNLVKYMGFPAAYKERKSIYKVIRVRYVFICVYVVVILVSLLILTRT